MRKGYSVGSEETDRLLRPSGGGSTLSRHREGQGQQERVGQKGPDQPSASEMKASRDFSEPGQSTKLPWHTGGSETLSLRWGPKARADLHPEPRLAQRWCGAGPRVHGGVTWGTGGTIFQNKAQRQIPAQPWIKYRSSVFQIDDLGQVPITFKPQSAHL